MISKIITFLKVSVFVLIGHQALATEEIYQPAHNILPAIIQNTSRLELNISTNWNTKNNARNLESADVEGSIWLKDFIKIILQDKTTNIASDMTPDILVGRENMQIKLKAHWADNGQLRSVIEFHENSKKSELPVLIKSKAFGKIQLRIKEINWSAQGLKLKNNEKKDIKLIVSCLLEQKNNAERYKENWSQIDCLGHLEYNAEKDQWFYRIQLKPKLALQTRTANLHTSCLRPNQEIRKDLSHILEQYKAYEIQFPYIVNNPSYPAIEASGDSQLNPIQIKAALFVRPQVGKIKIPGAPFGLYVDVPDDSIISVCIDQPLVVVNFYKLQKKFYLFGEEQIHDSKVSVRWSVLEPISEKVFDLAEKIPVAGQLIMPLERIINPVLTLPNQVIEKLVPVSGINQVIVYPEHIEVKFNGLMIKKFDISTKNIQPM